MVIGFALKGIYICFTENITTVNDFKQTIFYE